MLQYSDRKQKEEYEFVLVAALEVKSPKDNILYSLCWAYTEGAAYQKRRAVVLLVALDFLISQ
jgi:hypothetical protein